jgi:hypothetical protein
MGPFETIELNAPGGIPDYCARYTGFYEGACLAPIRPARKCYEPERGPRHCGLAASPTRRTTHRAQPAGATSACGAPGRTSARSQRLTIETEDRAGNGLVSRKVIITCAVTGAIHTPSMSPHLPVTPQEIADAAVGAAEAGAAIVHLHARNPKTGQPDQSPRPSRRSSRSSSSARTA